MDTRGIKKAIKEVIFPGELGQVRILFGQGDKMTHWRMDPQHSKSFEKIQEQGVCLDLVAGLVGKNEKSPVEVQHLIELADRIGIDVVEQESSFLEFCSRQAQNAFGRQIGVCHGDKDHIFKDSGFNLRGEGDRTG